MARVIVTQSQCTVKLLSGVGLAVHIKRQRGEGGLCEFKRTPRYLMFSLCFTFPHLAGVHTRESSVAHCRAWHASMKHVLSAKANTQ